MDETVKMGKAAFRTAYEYFEQMQPVRSDVDFWMVAAKRANEKYNEAGQSSLAQALILAVFSWMDTEAKKEPEA